MMLAASKGMVLTVVLLAACRTGAGGPTAASNGPPATAATGAPDAALGATLAGVRADCEAHGGSFAVEDDEATCRGAKTDWAPDALLQTWLAGDRVTARTSSGPLESFDEAKARADRLAALAWGKPEEAARTYVCAAMDPTERLAHARARRCRYSRFFRDGDRVVHVLVVARGDRLWQAVLDEQRAAVPGPPLMNAPYPTKMGPFTIGDSVAQARNACQAAGGGYTPAAGLAASCRPVDAPALELRGATAWLADCKAGLCHVTFVVDAATASAAIDAFVPVRDALVRAFGPPANVGLGICPPASASRLAAALELGHCEPLLAWKQDDGIISLQARPADKQAAYPPAAYSVLVTFSTPMYEKEQRNLPPADFLRPR